MINIFKYIALVVFFAGCGQLYFNEHQNRLHSSVRDNHSLVHLNTLLISPVENGYNGRGLLNLPVDVNERLAKLAFEQLDLKIFPAKELGEFNPPITEKKLKDIRRKHGVDGVLVLVITGYKEREGSRVGATEPAEVSFRMNVISTLDGSSIWNASYAQKDEAISENLLRAKQILNERKGKGWLTAQQILEMGISKSFQQLSEVRGEQFFAEK